MLMCLVNVSTVLGLDSARRRFIGVGRVSVFITACFLQRPAYCHGARTSGRSGGLS